MDTEDEAKWGIENAWKCRNPKDYKEFFQERNREIRE